MVVALSKLMQQLCLELCFSVQLVDAEPCFGVEQVDVVVIQCCDDASVIGSKILERSHIIMVIIIFIICCNIVFNCIIIVCSDMLSKHSELVLILWVENCYWLIFIVIIFILLSVSALPDEGDIVVILDYLFSLEKSSSGE